jgi:putative redox protein
MQFLGVAGSGHTAVVDAAEEGGGLDSAPRPTELLLIAEGGCTGMDVVSVLKKMKVDFSDFEMEISGERTEEHPKYIKKVHIVYKIWGNVPEENFKKAIDLSLEKYCTVANTLKGKAAISYEYQINPKRDGD